MSDTNRLLPQAPDPKLLEPPHDKPKKRPGWARRHPFLIALILFGVLVLIFLAGFLPRHSRDKEIKEKAALQAAALPQANAVNVQRSPSVTNLFLPATMAPLREAYLYARATGYVKHRYADIGDRVREGELLADIDAPDLDAQVAQGQASLEQAREQLAQARAALENSRAQEDLARVTWQRYSVLVQHGAVSRQDADQEQVAYRSAQANTRLQEAGVRTAEQNVNAMQGNLDRLIALQSFKQVKAPFAGVITARNFDVGALVSSSGGSLGQSSTPLGGTQAIGATANAGSSGSSLSLQNSSASSPNTPGIGDSGELYRIAALDVMRILVGVPQENAPSVQVGQGAEVIVQQYFGRSFHGRVARTTNALDPTARTLLTEVDVDNPQRLLMPGMYAQVRFADTRSNPPILLPGDAVMEGPNGLEVAILEYPTAEQEKELKRKVQEAGKDESQRKQAERQASQARRIHVQKVEVGRDYGPEIEVIGGIAGWEYVVVNPGDAVREGALVMPRAAPTAQTGGGQAGGPNQGPGGGNQSPSMIAPTQQKSNGQQKGSQKQGQQKKSGGGGQ